MSKVLRLLAIALVFASARIAASQDFLVSRPATAGKAPAKLAVGETSTTAKGETRRLALGGGAIVLLNQNTRVRRPEADVLIVEAGEAVVDAPKSSPLKVRTKTQSYAVEDARIAFRLDDAPSVLVLRGSVKGQGTDVFTLKTGQRRENGRTTNGPRPSHDLQWTAPLVEDALLVPASRSVGGELVAKDPQGNDAKIVLRRLRMSTSTSRTASPAPRSTRRTSTPRRFPLEGTFLLPAAGRRVAVSAGDVHRWRPPRGEHGRAQSGPRHLRVDPLRQPRSRPARMGRRHHLQDARLPAGAADGEAHPPQLRAAAAGRLRPDAATASRPGTAGQARPAGRSRPASSAVRR